MPKQHENDPAMTENVLQHRVFALTAEVGALREAVERMTDQWRMQEEAATRGRAALHEKIDTNIKETTGLTHRLGAVEKAVTLVEPSIRLFNEEKLRDEGAKSMGRMIWSGILIAAGAAGWGLHELFAILWHK